MGAEVAWLRLIRMVGLYVLEVKRYSTVWIVVSNGKNDCREVANG